LKTFLKHGKRADSLKDNSLKKFLERSANQLFWRGLDLKKCWKKMPRMIPPCKLHVPPIEDFGR